MNRQKEAALKTKITQLTIERNYQEAEKVCSYLAQNLPADSEVHYALAQLLERNAKFDVAAKQYIRAAKMSATIAEKALSRSAELCLKCNLFDLGLAVISELKRLFPSAEKNLLREATIHRLMCSDLSAVECYEQLLKNDPSNENYCFYIAQASNHMGENDKCLEFYQRARELNPSLLDIERARLFAMNYSDCLDDQTVYDAHRSFGDEVEAKYPSISSFRPKKTGAKIKVGYVSADFKRHSVANFMKPILANIDTEKVEVYCYSDVDKPDNVTEEIKSFSVVFRNIFKAAHDDVEAMIREDEIDIVIDLVGLTGNSRFEVYARKVAPIQINYLGYPNTLGLSRVDYRLVDNFTDPKGSSEILARETLLRMPQSFLCYSPNDEAPECVISPSLEAGYITFGCFNVFPKISNVTFNLWIRVLNQISDSRLLIKGRIFGDQRLKDRVLKRFEDAGVESSRITLIPMIVDTADHLACYNKVDINLDTYPYHGTTTTCEAMWQGVPTLTLAGKNHRSRVGVSILSNVGLTDWIANNEEEYVNLAIEKASNITELSKLRESLREKMRNSPLMDGKRFTKNLENIYENLVQEHGLRES